MKTMNICYVGPALGGRRTALTAVLRRATSTASEGLPVVQGATAFAVELDGVGRHVSASVSSTRSVLWYEDFRDASLPPAVRREVSELVQAEGYIFVVDSQVERLQANLEALSNLERDLSAAGAPLGRRPVVFQMNKRDLPNTCELSWAPLHLATANCAYVPSVASQGRGCIEALETLRLLIARG